jgi:hypothetical protein
MSVEKQTLFVPSNKEIDNNRLNHLNHLLKKIYETLKENDPERIERITKYDLVAKDVNECMLILEYRARKKEKFDISVKKIKKLVSKI